MKTVLFDLDGTLLQINMEEFLNSYFKAIAGYCAELAPPQEFIQKLLGSTKLMLDNNGENTNEQVFMQDFLPALGKGNDQVHPILNRFYEEEFPKLSSFGRPVGMARQVVEEIVDQGWQIILATNPLFPRLAVLERMKWAGIDDLPWLHVTSYENSSSSKPNPKYYQEIVQNHKLDPQECWMIGNDAREDLVASEIGLKTFLVTDNLIPWEENKYQPHGQGSMADLLALVQIKRR